MLTRQRVSAIQDMTVGHQLISEGRWMQPELDLLKAWFEISAQGWINLGIHTLSQVKVRRCCVAIAL